MPRLRPAPPSSRRSLNLDGRLSLLGLHPTDGTGELYLVLLALHGGEAPALDLSARLGLDVRAVPPDRGGGQAWRVAVAAAGHPGR